ncbi:MAG TPA: insulinase family protein [Puia sp.]|nr:insulinase family protein [Puia sp.]
MKYARIVGACLASLLCIAVSAQPGPSSVNAASSQRAPSSAQATQPVPLDPALRLGHLPNGFTYYIRRNVTPSKRAYLYLVNKVGSILEDEDQRGLAHFMEHMNFNGTTHFPKNQLVDYLQHAGVTFGADLNAHTGFDETVYELPIPTDDTSMLTSGLRIIRDWAQEALLDSVEIDKERGVVLEEERLAKGAKDRMLRAYLPMVVNHSRYADRLPIGVDSILRHFQRPVIDRFRRDWYRPDLQAIIVVGDVDPQQVEKEIQQLFSNLAGPVQERPRPDYTVTLTGRNQFRTVTDKEQGATTIEMMWKQPALNIQTDSGYLALITRSLFNLLLDQRRAAVLTAVRDPAFTGVSTGTNGFLGGLDAFSFDVDVKNGRIEQGFRQAYTFLSQVRRFGFTIAELDRAKKRYLLGEEQQLHEKDKTPSLEFVKEYQRHFLQREASPGIEWEYRFSGTHLDEIGLNTFNNMAAACMPDKDRDILLLASEKELAGLPDEATLLSWMKAVDEGPLAPYKDDSAGQILMREKPALGKVISRKDIPAIGVTLVKFANGLSVALKPTDFKNDEIGFRGFAPGGSSLYDDSDYDAAADAARLEAAMGVGDLSPIALNKLLAGKAVKGTPYIDARSQGFSGSSSTADIETALQLVNLYFTHPRTDSLLFRNIIENSRAALANRYADPASVFSDTLSRIMGGYTYRSSPPIGEKLDRITMQKVLSIYRQRFADASNFTFVFVGNFSVDSLLPLLAQYLGSLPSTHRREQARDLGTHIPPGIIERSIYKGKEDKAIVRLVFSGDYVFGPQSNMELQALGQILQMRLLQRLREDEGEVYAPSVQAINNKEPKNRFALIAAFGCAPQNADHLVTLVQQEMDSIRIRGPLPEDVDKYKAGYLKHLDLALRDNGTWLGYLFGQLTYHDDMLEILNNRNVLDKIDQTSLRSAARIFLEGKNMIRVTLLPEPQGLGIGGGGGGF